MIVHPSILLEKKGIKTALLNKVVIIIKSTKFKCVLNVKL